MSPVRRRSLLRRILLIAAVSVAAIFFIERGVQLTAAAHQREELVQARGQLLANIQASALGAPAWNLDQDQIDGILTAMAADPDFRVARFVDAKGKEVGRHGTAGEGSGSASGLWMVLTAPIAYQGKSLGALTLQLSRASLREQTRRDVITAAATDLLVLAAVLAALYGSLRLVFRPLDLMRRCMVRLAAGELTAEVPGAGRRDEVGEMAEALGVFRAQALENNRLAAEREHHQQQLTEEKKATLLSMAASIEQESAAAVEQILHQVTAMTKVADAMVSTAERNGQNAADAVTPSEQAQTNAQGVAGSIEALSAAMRAISTQATHSSDIVRHAVEAGRGTRSAIDALTDRVSRIGSVAGMISDIAAKTNLLALNATIEAARAGEAGKGFAVVASEVKALAMQTARSTEEIDRHLGEVRSAVTVAVQAVARIEQSVTEIDSVAGSIATSVAEQSGASGDIARVVAETAEATRTLAQLIGEIARDAGQARTQAATVHANASGLCDSAETLKGTVARVVRTATQDLDRRLSKQSATECPCQVRFAGSPVHPTAVDSGGAARR